MNPITRLLPLLAALIAVVAGLAAGFTWLHHHVSRGVVVAIGLGLAGFVGGVAYVRFDDLETDSKWLRWVAKAGITLLLVGLVIGLGLTKKNLVASYVLIGVGFAIPMVWILYDSDQKGHKRCPDCWELVKVQARVCRYCGYEFHPPD